MTTKERYDKIFTETLSLDPGSLNAALAYQSVPEWDSVGHMTLMAGLEAEFDIMMETDDIIAFSSYVKGIEILVNYGIQCHDAASAEVTV
jgi:acyl carrier protein